MSTPTEIPKPLVLDPDRPMRHRDTQLVEDDTPQSELLEKALHESCAYARQLWQTLDGIRGYLLASLPPDPRAPGTDRSSASPSGPDDEAGWQAWIDAFSSVTSVLCGPHGDSGFGRGRAREEAQLRRSAPVLQVAAGRGSQQSASSAQAAPGHEQKSPAQPTSSAV